MGETRNSYEILAGSHEGNRPLVRPRRRWRIILEWILRKYGGKASSGCIWLRTGTGRGRLF